MEKEKQTFIAHNTAELQPVATAILTQFKPPVIFCIHGEMGAGKTTFIHAVCDLLGLHFLGSPTFSLVHEYSTHDGVELIHFDLYRVKSADEAREFGFQEYLDRNAYIFIEWPDVVDSLLPPNTQKLYIEDLGDQRRIRFE